MKIQLDGIRTKQIRVATLLTILMTIALIGLGSIITYWNFSGRDVLKFNKEPIPVKPLFVKSEESITLEVDFCKVNGVPGEVERRLVSEETEISAKTVIESQPKGCYKYELPIPIPPQTPPGKYFIKYRVTYKTNPLHTVVEEVNSELFQVVP